MHLLIEMIILNFQSGMHGNFSMVLSVCRHLAGGEGVCENTTIPRYLQTNPDGTQKVQNESIIQIFEGCYG